MTGRLAVVVVAFAMVGCETSSSVPKAPVIGHAFAGPLNLPIRKEIAPKSETVATVHFPEKLAIIQQKRHFVKVRTAKNVEGWTDERLLLDEAAMDGLRKLAADSKDFPSQGKASTYDVLNVHTEPQRLSPSYIQIAAGEKVDVIGHRLVSKTALPRKTQLVKPPPPRPKKEKKKAKAGRIPPVTPPAPPKLPDNWVELSKEREPPPEPVQEKADVEEEKVPDSPDDWTLIRASGGQCGWVLTRRIFMAIPDEVAQYAEGRRITSYFSIGKVKDEEQTKDIWLWTTIDSGVHPYDFDSFRVFVWSLRHHRFETALIQRRIEGKFPVKARDGGFTITYDGAERRFEMQGNRVARVQ